MLEKEAKTRVRTGISITSQSCEQELIIL